MYETMIKPEQEKEKTTSISKYKATNYELVLH